MIVKHYDLLILGGGISGTALLFAAARYSNLSSIGLVEKHGSIAAVNSSGRHNSQTLHCGDIETNYTLEKALAVQRSAAMIPRYAALVPEGQEAFLFKQPKMVLAVGESEVDKLKARFDQFAPHYPSMRWLDRDGIARTEPHVAVRGGKPRSEALGACASQDEYCAVDFGALARSFVRHANQSDKNIAVHLNTLTTAIHPRSEGFEVVTEQGGFFGKSVVVSAGGHSLLFAQRMGYGLEFSVLPVAGSFYYAPKILNGKVYTLQNDKLPFAAIHGDPDVLERDKTRFGPTALILPMLERYAPHTIMDFLRVVHIDSHVLKVMGRLFADADIRNYIGKNILFEVPLLRRRLFLKDAQKIVPDLRLKDLTFAYRTGGVRPQLIDKTKDQLLLGEAKINPGSGIIFNMTPSPGATSCLANAERDLEAVTQFLGATFDKERFLAELAPTG